MNKKYLLFSLEDSRLKSIAEILKNKTAGKIINFLSEKEEASEKDISEKLGIPLNTAEYNIRKMVQAGIIEESKNFFWSPKGRKIKMYRFSNKSIVISPKGSKLNQQIKQIIPIALMSGIAAVAVKFYFSAQRAVVATQEEAFALAAEGSAKAAESASIINTENYWLWFLAGAIFAIIIFALKMILYQKSGETK
ncbi:MAG: helix-turn-helix domain-containing protein [Nanoarchaeota archaeon]